jgi:ubiquinone/menaquinone biosynthesis C-methylase UbiE
MGLYHQYVFPRLCDWLLGQRFLDRYRRELLAQVQGDVLEIGFGTGLNLPHYPPHVRKITTVEPNAGMNRLARRRIAATGMVVDQQVRRGADLPFADNAFGTVVSTFTLCSIDQVERALNEVYRVLRPGGRFLFLEHGLSPRPSVQKWQRRLNRVEQALAAGCRLDRDIRALVSAQPFAAVDMDQFTLERTPPTHGSMYRGLALK